MVEFQSWSSCDLGSVTKDRVLWLFGPPGVGKSTLAAYFVEFLRSFDKDAILAYFFIRRDSEGLTKPSDIARTLAYQCSEIDMNIRSSLEILRRNGFKVDDSIGLHLLSNKLLLEPLAKSERSVYIILDGLDEADQSFDSIDRRRSSIEILIDSLCNLRSSRLLLLCRPQSVPSKFKQQAIFRTIGFSDNRDDIEAFVRRQLNENKTLQTRFAKEGIDPIPFFLSNSRGIFLWVVLLLEQLSKASRSVFQKYVRDVTQAPSDMAQLYANILHCLDDEQRRWLREILFWIVASRRQLTIKELQSAAELSLEDELDNFRDFVELQCGSIFLIAELEGRARTVQVVHETFRSFLAIGKDCPADLQVTIDNAHSHLASTCLNLLATETVNSEQPIYQYISSNWNYHLIHVKQGGSEQNILTNVFQFFQSEGLKQWVYYGLTEHWNVADPLASETDIEDKALRDVRDWLIRDVSTPDVKESSTNKDFSLACRWRDSVLNEPNKLGEYIGKVSALLWLFEELGSEEITKAAFELAARHYWRRDGRIDFNNRTDLKELIDTRFAAMLVWAGESSHKKISQKNLEVAKSTLQRWDEGFLYKTAIASRSSSELWSEIESKLKAKSPDLLHASLNAQPSTSIACKKLATAQISNGLLTDAIETMKQAVQFEGVDWQAWMQLGDAHRSKNEYEFAVSAYQKAISLDAQELGAYNHLSEVYHTVGDHSKAIEILEKVVQESPDADSWAGLGRAYRIGLEEKKAIAAFQRSIEINPSFAPGWKSLVDIYNIQGEFHRTVEAYEKETVANPACSWVWSGLGDAYCAQKRYEAAIKAYKTALDRNTWDCWAWTCLGDAYRISGRFDEAIESLWISVEKNPHDSWPWKGLGEAYNAKGELARAIAVYFTAIEKIPIDYSLYISTARLLKIAQRPHNEKKYLKLALERCPTSERLLFAFIHLPTSHLFSSYPTISIDNTITASVIWTPLARAMFETGEDDAALEIYERVINEYNLAIKSTSNNRLLWVYSSHSASRGFDPFEKKYNLPNELLWVLLGEAYKAKGDFDSAITAFENALGVLPDNKWLWESLANMYTKSCNQTDGADEARKKISEVTGQYSKTFYCY